MTTPTTRLIEAAESLIILQLEENEARRLWDESGCGTPEWERWQTTMFNRDSAIEYLRDAVQGLREGAAEPVTDAGMVWAPHFRGYAHLGTGNYCINHSEAGSPAELVVSIATEADKAGRSVGEDRENPPGKLIYPEEIAVRICFENVAGLDALEKQLRYLRETHFPASTKPPAEPIGEVVVGEEGMVKGWTVVKWRADLPPVAAGTKLYATPPTSDAPAQGVALWTTMAHVDAAKAGKPLYVSSRQGVEFCVPVHFGKPQPADDFRD